MKFYLTIVFTVLMQLSFAQNEVYEKIRKDPKFKAYKIEYIAQFTSKEYHERENFIYEFLDKLPKEYFKIKVGEDFDDWIVPRLKDSKFATVEEARKEKRKFNKIWEESMSDLEVISKKKSALHKKYGNEIMNKMQQMIEWESMILNLKIEGMSYPVNAEKSYEEIREDPEFLNYKADYIVFSISKKNIEREDFISEFLTKVPKDYTKKKSDEDFDTWIISRIKDSKFSSVKEAIEENKKFDRLWAELQSDKNALNEQKLKLKKKYGNDVMYELQLEIGEEAFELEYKLRGVALVGNGQIQDTTTLIKQ
ncbi:MAG: hypothetical protein WCY89_11000 [Flavobacteriaceae bacterium]